MDGLVAAVTTADVVTMLGGVAVAVLVGDDG